MLTLENPAGDDIVSSGNGQESDADEGYTHQKYDPEDFSQSAINEGQRIINYQLTEVAKKLSHVLARLSELLAKTPGINQGELVNIKKVIAEAIEISNTVADIYPPGCQPPPPPPPSSPPKTFI